MLQEIAHLWQRKKTIDMLVQELEISYKIPTRNLDVLANIADDYDINIYFCEAAIFPICSRKKDCHGKKVMVLPETYSSEADIANCAHELGHLLLDTRDEREAIYFAWRIQQSGFLREHLVSLKYTITKVLETYQEYRDTPRFIEESLEPLKKQGVSPLLIDAVKTDTRKILNFLCRGFKDRGIDEEQQDILFSKVYRTLRRICP